MWWHDRAGRFSALKAICLAACVAPSVGLMVQWGFGDCGARPLDFLNHRFGDWALRFILASLAITPLRSLLRAPQLLLIRRMLGVAGFLYLIPHVGFYIGLQNGRLGFVASEIIHHAYLIIGFSALLGFLALALTSTDRMVRRLGRNWRRLHWLTYPASVAAVIHFMMQGKVIHADATTQAGILLWLLGWRLCPAKWRGQAWFLAAYSVAAGLATMALEAGWFALFTHVNVGRIVAANGRWGFAPRPGVWVLLLGVALSAVAAGWQRLRPARR